jgi:chromosome segregation ATPase
MDRPDVKYENMTKATTELITAQVDAGLQLHKALVESARKQVCDLQQRLRAGAVLYKAALRDMQAWRQVAEFTAGQWEAHLEHLAQRSDLAFAAFRQVAVATEADLRQHINASRGDITAAQESAAAWEAEAHRWRERVAALDAEVAELRKERSQQVTDFEELRLAKERAEAAGAEGVERLEAEVARRRAAEGWTEELSAEVSQMATTLTDVAESSKSALAAKALAEAELAPLASENRRLTDHEAKLCADHAAEVQKLKEREARLSAAFANAVKTRQDGRPTPYGANPAEACR